MLFNNRIHNLVPTSQGTIFLYICRQKFYIVYNEDRSSTCFDADDRRTEQMITIVSQTIV